MTILVGGTEKRIGMALSGGGFRAAAFHLGAFRKLHQLGLLWKLDLLTCVSGGSIAGGAWANMPLCGSSIATPARGKWGHRRIG